MASRLNQLFQINPQSFLERTVLFTDGLGSAEAFARTTNRLLANIDIEPVQSRAKVRILSGLHEYLDTPMVSFFVPLEGSVLVPKLETPHRFIFMPEFGCSRLLVRPDGEDWLRLSLEQNLYKMLPAPETEPDSPYCDSINYWEFTTGDLVGNIRATAVVFKEGDKPWRFVMQQIVGAAGFEVVCKTFSRELRYS